PAASTGPVPDLTSPVVLLDPRQAKGLEFDTVIVVEPAEFGLSDLYVALTRATQRLGVVHTGTLPPGLDESAGAPSAGGGAPLGQASAGGTRAV
ncbi:ATP-binding domain-containing protein, partial [Streptomyces albireticuli]